MIDYIWQVRHRCGTCLVVCEKAIDSRNSSIVSVCTGWVVFAWPECRHADRIGCKVRVQGYGSTPAGRSVWDWNVGRWKRTWAEHAFMALWAAQRIVQKAGASSYSFPRYNRGSRTSANSASAAINKWLKNHVPAGCTMHSFRHSMRDRLRAVQCPADIADQIGGWATDGVGQGYGSGYPIEVLMDWMGKTVAATEVG